MTATTGTITGGRRLSGGGWAALAAATLLAVAVAVGGVALLNRDTTPAPAPKTVEIAPYETAPAVHVPGLIKAGLQPRPYSPIVVPKLAPAESGVPAGFVPVGANGDFRPMPGS
jgi:hypothetical protein